MIAVVSLRLLYLIFLQVLGLILIMGRRASSKDTRIPDTGGSGVDRFSAG